MNVTARRVADDTIFITNAGATRIESRLQILETELAHQAARNALLERTVEYEELGRALFSAVTYMAAEDFLSIFLVPSVLDEMVYLAYKDGDRAAEGICRILT